MSEVSAEQPWSSLKTKEKIGHICLLSAFGSIPILVILGLLGIFFHAAFLWALAALAITIVLANIVVLFILRW